MKTETKTFVKNTGKATIQQLVVTIVGSAVLGGAKFLGGKIGSVFAKKPLTVDNINIPDIPVTEDTVSMGEVTSEDVKVEVTEV
jgi:hypothetical protein